MRFFRNRRLYRLYIERAGHQAYLDALLAGSDAFVARARSSLAEYDEEIRLLEPKLIPVHTFTVNLNPSPDYEALDKAFAEAAPDAYAAFRHAQEVRDATMHDGDQIPL